MLFIHKFITFLFPQAHNIAVFDTIPQKHIEKHVGNIHIKTTNTDCIAPLLFRKKIIHDAIIAMKYHNHVRATQLLGNVLAPYLMEEISEQRLFGAFHHAIIIPIPLHHTRFQERGYNQSERISNIILECFNETTIRLNTHALIRIKNTKTQTHTHSKKERHLNLHQAFSVIDTHAIVNQDIILIDDVVTTGATLSSAKKTLQKAGARNVLCVAVAH